MKLKAPKYRIGFPIDDATDWEFVLVRAKQYKHTRVWFGSTDGSTASIKGTGAVQVVKAAKELELSAEYFGFCHVTSTPVGAPQTWPHRSDAAACALAMVLGEVDITGNQAIVLVSCRCDFGEGDGSFGETTLHDVTGHEDEHKNTASLEKKWSAVTEGRAASFPIIALVLHEDDAARLATKAGEPTPLTEDTFQDILTGKIRQPALVSVKEHQMPLLAQSLNISNYYFIKRKLSSRRWPVAVATIFALLVIGVIVSAGYWPRGESSQVAQPKEPLVQQISTPSPTSSPEFRECPSSLAARFSDNSVLRILVFDFYGSDNKAKEFGHDTGMQIQEAFERYKAREMESPNWPPHLAKDGFEVYLGKCYVNDNKRARELGAFSDADVVIWGRVRYEKERGMITPFITAVAWPTLDAVASRAVGPVGLHALTQMTLPELSTDPIMPIVRFLFGVYAYQNQQFPLASLYFQEPAKRITGIKQAWPLQFMLSHSLVLAGKLSEAGPQLLALERSCGSEKVCLLYKFSLESRMLVEQGAFNEAAIVLRDKALPKAKEVDDKVLLAGVLTDLSELEAQKGDSPHAEALATSAIQTIRTVSLSNLENDDLRVDSWQGAISGDTQKAVRYYQRWKDVWISNGNYISKINAAHIAGLAFDKKRQFQEAIKWYKIALDDTSQADIPSEKMELQFNIGIAYEVLHQTNDAIQYLEVALLSLGNMNIPSIEASVRSRLALLYLEKGERKRAANILAKLPLSGFNNTSEDVAMFERAGIAYGRLGQFSLAARQIEFAIRTIMRIRVHLEFLPNLYAEKAYYWGQAGDVDEAVSALSKAAEIQRGVGNIKSMHEAFSCLDYACELASLKNRSCKDILQDLKSRYLIPEDYHLAAMARLLSRMGRMSESRAYYKKLAVWYQRRGEKTPTIVNKTVDVGLARIKAGGLFDGCFGVLIREEIKDAKTPSRFLPGDVILKFDDKCVSSQMGLDFIVQTSDKTKQHTLTVLRAGKSMKLPLDEPAIQYSIAL